jgi:hypothetical protein
MALTCGLLTSAAGSDLSHNSSNSAGGTQTGRGRLVSNLAGEAGTLQGARKSVTVTNVRADYQNVLPNHLPRTASMAATMSFFCGRTNWSKGPKGRGRFPVSTL